MRQPQQHRHHHRNFPPQEYTDLSNADLKLLTHLLGYAPARDSSSFAAYKTKTRELISELPDHLRCKHTWLSKLCSLHKKLSPLPIISVLNAIRLEIENDFPAIWSPLLAQGRLSQVQIELIQLSQDLSTNWMPPAAFVQVYGRHAKRQAHYDQITAKCAACILSQIGGHADALIALGACIVGRVSSSIWHKSKRIQWIESWIGDCVKPEKQETAVSMMWDLGKGLRKARLEAPERPGRLSQHFELMANASDQQFPPTRPHRSGSQDDHIALMMAASSGDDTDRLPVPDDDLGISAPNNADPGTAGFALKAQQSDRVEAARFTPLADDAPSVYSQAGAHSGQLKNPTSTRYSSQAFDDTKSEFIDLYRRTLDLEPAHDPAQIPRADSPLIPPPPQSTAQEDPNSLAYFPRHKMKPITIISSSFGQDAYEHAEPPRTSKLWKRRAEGRVPALRVGRNGEVKGPDDPVTLYS